MRSIGFAVFVLAAGLAGCLGGDDTPPGDDLQDEHDHSDHDHGNETMEANGTNTAPTATLIIENAAGNATTDENGTVVATVPLNLTFGVIAEDVDGDELNWTLDTDGDGSPDTEGVLVADNGTYSAVNFTFSYTEASTFNVTLTVGDAANATTATLRLNLTAGDQGSGAVGPFVHEGSTVAPTNPVIYVTGAVTCVSFMTGQSGIDCLLFTLAPEEAGLPFVTTSSAVDSDVEFWTACSPTGEALLLASNEGHEKGTVPAGAGCAVVWEFVDAADLTLTVG